MPPRKEEAELEKIAVWPLSTWVGETETTAITSAGLTVTTAVEFAVPPRESVTSMQ